MKTIALDISVLNEKNKTGVGVYTYQLIKNLLEINKKDKFILFGISTLQTFEYLKNIEFKKFPNVEMKVYKMPAKFFRRAFLLWQKINWPKIEKFIGPVDILHSFNWNLPPLSTGKMVATVFDMTPFLFPQFHLEKTIQLDKVRLDRIKKYADLVITISQNSKKDFLKFAPGKRVEVIYPSVSEMFLENFYYKKDELVMKKNSLKPNGLRQGYILCVATLEPRKNVEGLIRAIAKLASQGQALRAYKLVIAGAKGWMSDHVYQLPKKLGIEDNVKFIGRVEDEDLPALYKNALCLVYPSIYEGFGIPILEAQACGCPVIASNTSSMPEVGGRGALYVNPSSVDEIAKAIRGFGEFREMLIEAGFENVKRFSWEKSAEKLKSLYQRILK